MVGDETIPDTSGFTELVEQQNGRKFLVRLKCRAVPIGCEFDSVRGLQLNALFGRTISGTPHAAGILSSQLEVKQVIKSIQEGTDGLGFGNQVSILGMHFVVHFRIQTGNCIEPTLVRYQDRSRLLLQVLDEDLSANKRVLVSVGYMTVKRLGR